MSNYILFIISFFLFYRSSAQSNSQLHQDIKNLLVEQKLTGAVWAIVDSSGITTDCVGYKNAETKEYFKPSDKVHIGSIAKTILAVGILHLVTEGKIELEESVDRYLPNTSSINPWDSDNPVTVRHLLDHTSGLSDARLWHIFSTSSTPNTPLSAFYKDDPALLSIHAKPGSMYSYSNMGYTLLGMVIEAVTNQRYEKYLDENILTPIGMTNTTFRFVSQIGDHADKYLAMGHFDNTRTVSAQPIYLRPAGQLTTTGYDMGLFLSFLMSDGKIGITNFVDETLLKSIGKQFSTDAFLHGVPYGYAMGAYTRDRHGVTGISVTGNILGFAARVYWFPDQKKAFFISHNMDSETADYEGFNEILIEHLKIKSETISFRGVTTKNILKTYGGYYIPVITKVEPFGILDKAFSFTKVEISSKGVTLRPMQKKSQTLTYLGENLFMSEGRTNISHSFYKNENDELILTDGISTLKKESGFKILLIAISFGLGLLGMAYLLCTSVYQFIKFKYSYTRQPVFYVSFTLLTIFVSIVFLIFQPFISLGDKTAGSALLYIGTFSLPILALVSFIKTIKIDKTKWLYKFDFISLLFVLQFSILLIFNDVLPLALWE